MNWQPKIWIPIDDNHEARRKIFTSFQSFTAKKYAKKCKSLKAHLTTVSPFLENEVQGRLIFPPFCFGCREGMSGMTRNGTLEFVLFCISSTKHPIVRVLRVLILESRSETVLFLLSSSNNLLIRHISL